VKLICERDALRAALSHVASRARNKLNVPILQNVKIDAQGRNLLSLTATDLDTRCVSTCAAEISAPGATTVSADRLARLVDGLPKGAQVTFDLRGHDMHVICGRSNYKLPTMPATDFPEFSEINGATDLILKPAEAKRLFGETSAALPTNDTRVYLTGAFLTQRDDGHIMATATDGIRLVRLVLASETKLPRGYIIPKPAMAEIVKLAAAGDVTIRCNDSLIEARAGTVVFTSKLVDATYPDLDRIIPPAASAFIEVDRDDFLAAFQRLEGLENEYSTINLRWTNGASAIEMALTGDGSGSETVPCTCEASDGEIAFKPSVLGAMLDVPQGEVIQLHIRDTNGPMRIVDPSDPELTVVAMPCKARN
jgi:DNA polymerase-3 subunit beta